MNDRIQITYGTERPRRQSPAGLGAQYLTEKKKRNGSLGNSVGLAVGALYAPLQLALNGGTSEAVEAEILKSEQTIAEYRALARQTVGLAGPEKKCSVSPEETENTNTTIKLGMEF